MKHLTRLIALLLIFLTLALSFAACAPKPEPAPEGVLRLSSNGKTDFRVVIGADASEDIRLIAEEFSGYFQKITGASIETVTDETKPQEKEICIGRTSRPVSDRADYDMFPEEALFCKADGERITLTGGSDRGVAYAVYDFLEKACGVRYYTPDYEKVPETQTLDIPNDYFVYDKPVFWFRTVEGVGAADPKWMVKMRLNSRQSLGSEHYQRDPFVGGGIGYAGWFVHTLADLAEMKKDYPDRETLINLQPCLTSEETYQTVLKNVRKRLETYPDARIISISQNDGSSENGVCTCDNCKAYYETHGQVQSALFVGFVCRIAEELKDEYPDVYFDTLAYNFTMLPPQNIEIPDNVIVRIAPAYSCMNHTYKENSCADYYGGTTSQKTSAKFRTASAGWAKIAKNRFVWDYDAMFYDYLQPFVNFDHVRKNLQNYVLEGYSGVYLQGESSGSNGLSELRSYLDAKLLWDPDMDDETYNEILTDFLNGYYGNGTAGPLKDYLRFVQDSTKDVHYNLYSTVLSDGYLPLAVTENEDGTVSLDTSVFIDPANGFFDKAESVEKTEEQALHLKKARTPVTLYEILATFKLASDYENASYDREALIAKNEAYHQTTVDCGITYLREGQKLLPPSTYEIAPIYWTK